MVPMVHRDQTTFTATDFDAVATSSVAAATRPRPELRRTPKAKERSWRCSAQEMVVAERSCATMRYGCERRGIQTVER